jgi:hypothetical protein
MGRHRTFAVLLLAVVLAGSGLDAFRASMKAMACCAKTDYSCAGLSTPDDCCRRMGHTSPASPSFVLNARDEAPLATVAIMPVVSTVLIAPPARHAFVGLTFKRPHDPPHLHPVPLLI